jgi:hypothetical protein
MKTYKKLSIMGFMLWDGIEIFNKNEVKLDRIKGEKPKCSDRYRTKESILTVIFLLLIYVFIVRDEMAKFGTEKSQRFFTEKIMSLNFSVSEKFPLRAWTYYDVELAIKRYNELRKEANLT